MEKREKIKRNIYQITNNNGLGDEIARIIASLYDYMTEKKLRGGCHAFSSILYVALSEMGMKPQLFVGECKIDGQPPFEHSWVSIDGKAIDIAVCYPLYPTESNVRGPIVFDIDASSMKNGEFSYNKGADTPMSIDTQIVINTSFDVYMSNYPYEKDGLWTVLELVMPETYPFDLELLKKKYANTSRNF